MKKVHLYLRQLLMIIGLLLLMITISCKENSINLKKYTIEEFYASENIIDAGFSFDDSKILFTSNKTGIQNAFSLQSDGSTTDQLTNSVNKSMYAKAYFPNDNRILLTSDNNGDEINHIYLREETGEIRDLTPWEGAKSEFVNWNHEKNGFYYKTTKRDPRFFDLFEMDINTFESKLIFENNEAYVLGPISKNREYLALTKSFSMSKSNMYLLNISTKAIVLFEESEINDSYIPQFFSNDNKLLYYLTNKGSEFYYLAKYNLETKEKTPVWKTNWDILYAHNTYSEKYRIIAVNEDARTKIHLFDLENEKEIVFPDFGRKDIVSLSISNNEKLLCLSVNSSALPTDIYIYNIENKDLNKLTNTLNPLIDPNHLVEGQSVKFISYDGVEVPALLYKPIIANSKNKVPAMLWIHGGPGGQTRLDYTLWNTPLFQYLVNNGYAVLAVNNRGSSGYGKTFFSLDDKRHGEDDLRDCIQAKEYLEGFDYIGVNKVGIIGASYGGYMVMAALAFAPEEFNVGVNIFGVTNWIRTLRSIPPFWADFKASVYNELGDPFSSDSVRLQKISPLFHTEKIVKPLMVLQGANDPRVLQIESDEMVNAVQKNGVPVEYVLFSDEGHGFRKTENEIMAYKKIVQFLDKYIKDKVVE